jgi:hypothetical protein
VDAHARGRAAYVEQRLPARHIQPLFFLHPWPGRGHRVGRGIQAIPGLRCDSRLRCRRPALKSASIVLALCGGRLVEFPASQAAASVTAAWVPRRKFEGDGRRRLEIGCVLHGAGSPPCEPKATRRGHPSSWRSAVIPIWAAVMTDFFAARLAWRRTAASDLKVGQDFRHANLPAPNRRSAASICAVS